MNKLPTITADFLEEEVEEPNDDSRLPTRYCKDGPAVEIGGVKLSPSMQASGADTTMWVGLQLVCRCDRV